VIGSGPAGLACAQQLNAQGHDGHGVRARRGGRRLVRFGVPGLQDREDRRRAPLGQLEAEGVEFRYGVDVGRRPRAAELRESYDAVVIATGSRVPRDLPVPGRELPGVHFAMEYLYQRNRFVAREHGPQVPGARRRRRSPRRGST
jgi:glutamate synthase (NADPH/NADH) small chain